MIIKLNEIKECKHCGCAIVPRKLLYKSKKFPDWYHLNSFNYDKNGLPLYFMIPECKPNGKILAEPK